MRIWPDNHLSVNEDVAEIEVAALEVPDTRLDPPASATGR